MSSYDYTGEERRHAPRHPLRLTATIRQRGGRRINVDLRDISTHGFGCEYASTLNIGEQMWLKFDHLEAMDVVVIRRDGFYYGLSFVTPLHQSAVDHLIAQYAKLAA